MKNILCFGDSNTFGNDLKTRFALSVADIAAGVEVLIQSTKNFFQNKNTCMPRILLISPIEIGEQFEKNPYSIYMGGSDAVQRSKEFPYYYKKVAERQQCYFLAASETVKAGEIDWMHLDETGHEKLAELICCKIRRILASDT